MRPHSSTSRILHPSVQSESSIGFHHVVLSFVINNNNEEVKREDPRKLTWPEGKADERIIIISSCSSLTFAFRVSTKL